MTDPQALPALSMSKFASSADYWKARAEVAEAALEEARKGQQWVPVSEQLPESGQTVLGFYPGAGSPVSGWNFATVTYRLEGGLHLWTNPEDDDDDFVAPSYWQPLPAAPSAAAGKEGGR
jgi:hypothetical protein